jgi:hypothetical protein
MTPALFALVLTLAVTFAGAVRAATPAAAASWLNPNPAIAVNGFNDQWVFWQGTNGHLWEAYNSGGSTWQGPTEIAQMGVLGSTPSVAVTGVNGEVPYVVWRGTDGALWFGYDDNGWHGPCRLGMGPIPAGSRPSIEAAQASPPGALTVSWKGANNALWYAYTTAGPQCNGWAGPYSLGDGPLGSVPSTFGPGGGAYQQTVWTGTGPQYDLWDYVAGGLYNLGGGPLGSPPSITEYPYPSHYMVFWAGTNRQLWYSQIDNNGSSGPVATTPASIGGGPLGGAPTAAFNGANTPDGSIWDIVWQGEDNGLWELSFQDFGSASLNEIPGMGPL